MREQPCPTPAHRAILLFSIVFALLLFGGSARADNDACLACHDDAELTRDDGRSLFVDPAHLEQSVHAGMECIDCHDQSADFDDIPHFDVYRPVQCSKCHDESVASFERSVHGRAVGRGKPSAPNCVDCHGAGGDAHYLQPLDPRSVEHTCRRCHAEQAEHFDDSVHHQALAAGKNAPGCITCHPVHAAQQPPSAGAVSRLCEGCHQGAMDELTASGHLGPLPTGGVISCASCHDVHGVVKPTLDQGTLRACTECHPSYDQLFEGSVHEEVFASGKMNCLSCHRAHQVRGPREATGFGCGRCHEEAEAAYRRSAHRHAHLEGSQVAAECGSCHGGHHVLASNDRQSPVNHFNIPKTCGHCHTDKPVITEDYVRLPVSLPSYLQSIHGQGWREGEMTAVCTDCHGSHDLYGASDPDSSVARQNLARTCGQCHAEIAATYEGSVHGKALEHGIEDAPVCTDCHDEHLILSVDDTCSAVSRSRQATETCGRCHEDQEMNARYALSPNVVGSYLDSYHGWAVERDCEAAASCQDCHTTHDIRSPLDPESSVHPDHVVATCGQCHENTNPQFAQSYNHLEASRAWRPHDYVRWVYIWLIVLTLGGMAVHNLLIYARELRAHYRSYHARPTVRRMTRSEIAQHMVLAITFATLALTGFALRFPDAWWARALSAAGLNEDLRRLVHRVCAGLMVAASLLHIGYLLVTVRGRKLLRDMLPRLSDAREAVENVAYYLGLRKAPPAFGYFDYTQKAEYWALVWGTIVMSVTGFVLMFPDLATESMPAWVVRVCETVHFYEAILAVGAIVVWHLFFTVFVPREYPMSWIWITGRMPRDDFEHHHPRGEP